MRSVLIVEDVAETRRWLGGIVHRAFPEAQLVEASTLRMAQGLLRESFDLALIDLGLPDGSGLDVLRALRNQQSGALCVVTTAMGDDASIVAALSSGADGYLLKEQPAEVLSRQLLQLAIGVPALSPAVARRIMEHFRLTGPAAPPDTGLTQRETEVLGLIGRGMRNVEVAAELGLAETTVAGYIKAIYRKLGISSRAEASWHATRMGLGARPHGDD
ncbi:two component transcriptional regulator, LuxR family [Gemmobacter megaterium]|uniref:Two component transcriptional regulator, LuxR family n=1 Tax=Gemmobacter megaterium TaxID=1086013 RepID=A0A1N7MAU6_9RHOB|nr:response regulator transcription factor [Gemmobacter megaterium]GGE07826.1 DNA-binding response regulator [Gemmobacter megaterium]SIS83236.1 two component transcriptional regulator, LuxR family [Gemmobacter megaterium]